MTWFRFYHDASRNPKVQNLPPMLFKFWVNFLCVASESNPRGLIRSEAHLAVCLGLKKSQVTRWCDVLEGSLLVQRNSDGTLMPHDWDSHQRSSDDEAKRKSDYRARISEKLRNDMSRDNTGTCPGTCPSIVPPRVRADSDSETEEENSLPKPSLGEASASRAGVRPDEQRARERDEIARRISAGGQSFPKVRQPRQAFAANESAVLERFARLAARRSLDG